MAASYPNNARTFRNPTGSTTAVTSGGVDQHAADHTAVEEEVAAISSDLRTAKGVTANMAAKISAMDASIASAYVAGGTDVPIADGGTGASTAANARTNLGLGTAATKDIPAAGDASATQVVYGTDTRLTNARTPTGSVTSGDLTGSYPSPTIAKLQGNTVAAASPTSGQVLSWNSTLSQWEPSTVSGAGSITGSFPYIFVASSTATAAQKAAAGATYTCDGTNDEVQIAAALAALPASGGEVVLSPGTFYIGAANAITIPSNSSLRGTGGGLWGSDSGTVLKYATGAAAPAAPAVGNNYLVSAMIRCLGTSSQNRVNGQRIQDLGLDGSDKANLVGIYMHYVNVFHIDTLQLWAFPSFGIYFHGASDGTVKRVRFDYCGSTDGRTTGIYKGAMEFNDDATVTFTITAANVVAGDIYQTSNGAQFRVISSGTGVTSVATAPIGSPPTAAPSTLTRVSGTGPASLSYSAFSTTSDWANDNIIVESCWWEQCKDRAVQVRSGNTLGGQAGSDLGYSISFLNCKFENSSNNPRGGTSHSYIRISGAGVRILNSYFFVGDLLNNSLTEQLRAIILAESYYGVWIENNFFVYNGNSNFTFTITSASFVANDVYESSPGGPRFTVSSSGTGTSMTTSSFGVPPATASGTLTRVSGTGPTTITFSAYSQAVPTTMQSWIELSGGEGAMVSNNRFEGNKTAATSIIKWTGTNTRAVQSGNYSSPVSDYGRVLTSGTPTSGPKRTADGMTVTVTDGGATPSINTDVTKVFGITAQTVAITNFSTNLTGSPTNGDLLHIYIVPSNASNQNIAWGTSFEGSTNYALPTTGELQNARRRDYDFIWNSATSKWRLINIA